MIELSNKIQLEYNKSYIGKTVTVLVEEKQGEYFRGHAKNYLNVSINSAEVNLENEIVEVEIEKVENDILLGKYKK